MNAQPKWYLSPLWVLFTVLGAGAAWAISEFLQRYLSGMNPLTALITALLIGILVGIGQWFVLHLSLPALPWSSWILATTVGITLGGIIPRTIGGSIQDIPQAVIFGAISGVMLGVSQWIVLSYHVARAVWWIAVTTVAGVITFLLSLLPDQLVLNATLFSLSVAAIITCPAIPWFAAHAYEEPSA